MQANVPHKTEETLKSFSDLVEFVRTHDQLHRRFTVQGSPNPDKELKIEFDKILILSGVKDCIERYIHRFGDFEYDQEKAVSAVEPTVSYIFNQKLDIEISVPILFLGFNFDSFQIADGISIERISKSHHRARYKVKSYNTSTHQNVVSSATHALVLKGWYVPNTERMWDFDILSKTRAYPIELIDEFFGALRVITQVETGYAQVYAVAKEWEAHCTADLPYLKGATLRSYPSWFEDYYWNIENVPALSDEEMDEAKIIFNKVQSAKENSISLALRRLNRCVIRDDEEDAVLDATIALEALLSDGNQEMTHKLALRVGALSKLDDRSQKNPSQAFKDVKKIYGYRSAIAHGSRDLDKKRIIKITEEKSTTAHDLVVDYLRMTLRVVLKHEKYRAPKVIDEQLLLGEESDNA
ncbi:hypothetical protein [Marinobacter sp. MMG032]|uniref:Apea-like HEPN domain-containing protein n=1 Tax=Marinobacter sp. MMG032 TaxID=3158548 RepID=A0AAU7MQB6_9GAMM